jgi:hypothetical protein
MRFAVKKAKQEDHENSDAAGCDFTPASFRKHAEK